MAKSYFAILGVSSDASFEEIRSAYRKLAKAYHPDYFEGGSEAFRQIQEAYAVLADVRRRKEYEKSLKPKPLQPELRPTFRSEPEPLIPRRRPSASWGITPIGSPPNRGIISEDPLQHLTMNRRRRHHTDVGRVDDVSVEVPLTREQAVKGGNVRILVPSPDVCPSCRGSGGGLFHVCHHCIGSGVIMRALPVRVPFPPNLNEDHAVSVTLEAFGMKRFNLTVWFRVIRENPESGKNGNYAVTS